MILDLGLIDYEDAYRIQKEMVRKRKIGEIEDSVIVTEHPAIYTIGRTGKRDNLLVDEEILREYKIKVLDVDRGGDITFHGPGQLILYPIIDLRNRRKDLHQYLRDLEEVVINYLSHYSAPCHRLKDRTGVWVDNEKISFIGIAASDWITYHGLSLNINVDLGSFSMIRPCGLADVEVTSLNKILNKDIIMDEAKDKLLHCFNNIFYPSNASKGVHARTPAALDYETARR